ncbi:hypothetical protein KAJ89_04590 [Candidatus Parcubacteria bacterium]|nr:hypothetical protein [Candidatus Parcubacteria bacterium]
MDKQIEAIFQTCGYDSNPNHGAWRRIFVDVTMKHITDIKKNMYNMVALTLEAKAKSNDVLVINETIESLEDLRIYLLEHDDDEWPITIDRRMFIFHRPILFTKLFVIPESQIYIGPKSQDENDPSHGVFLAKGVKLLNVQIDAPTYVGENAAIFNTSFSHSKRYNYVGENTVISHVKEFLGSFVSGGSVRKNESGRERTYIHSRSLNNCFIGAYAGMADGTYIHNHPLPNILPATYDVLNDEPYVFKHPHRPNLDFKLPTLIGRDVSIGLSCRVHSGSIFQAGTIVPDGSRIQGYVYRTQHGETGHKPYGHFPRPLAGYDPMPPIEC